MKLASEKYRRDGKLLIVSQDCKTAVCAGDKVPTMQFALDNWDQVEPLLNKHYQSLNDGSAKNVIQLDLNTLAAPLPRSYQYLDGASYASHIIRNRKARGESIPEDFYEKPLVYQGTSHGFMGWNDPITFPDDDMGIDFEAEIAAITGDIPMGIDAETAPQFIHLFVLLNDISLRALIPAELKRTFGFLTGKPASTLGPIAVTPDELGDLWDGKMVSGNMRCHVRGDLFGELNTGIDSPYHYGHLISHSAKTRNFEAGTIIGLGTISNEDDTAGFACIGEKRAVETINEGEAKTSLLKFGDTVKIEHFNNQGESTFGAIEQKVVRLDIENPGE